MERLTDPMPLAALDPQVLAAAGRLIGPSRRTGVRAWQLASVVVALSLLFGIIVGVCHHGPELPFSACVMLLLTPGVLVALPGFLLPIGKRYNPSLTMLDPWWTSLATRAFIGLIVLQVLLLAFDWCVRPLIGTLPGALSVIWPLLNLLNLMVSIAFAGSSLMACLHGQMGGYRTFAIGYLLTIGIAVLVTFWVSTSRWGAKYATTLIQRAAPSVESAAEAKGNAASGQASGVLASQDALYPFRGRPEAVAPDINVYKIRLGVPSNRPGYANQLWIYVPAGKQPDSSLGCIFLAPSGTMACAGQGLHQGPEAEYLRYVRSGFVLVCFEVDGELPEVDPIASEAIEAYKRFLAAEAGLVNVRNAWAYAMARLREVDPERLYVAGHGSGGRLALLFAENEPRLKGCIAFAPTLKVSLTAEENAAIEEKVVGFNDALRKYTPNTHIANLRCPLFVSHASDDKTAHVADSETFLREVQTANRNAVLHRIEPGDDQASGSGNDRAAAKMPGLPESITWLKSLPAERANVPEMAKFESKVEANVETKIEATPGTSLSSVDLSRGEPLTKTSIILPPGTRPEWSRLSLTRDEAMHHYVHESLAAWLTGDEALLREKMRWYSEGKRPVMGLRWGFGIVSPNSLGLHVGEFVHEHNFATGWVGPAIDDGLVERAKSGRFGEWPFPVDGRIPRVPVLVAPTEEQLLNLAKWVNLDGLVLMSLSYRTLGIKQRVDTMVQARLIDMVSGKTMWKSEVISGLRINAMRGTANDIGATLVREVLENFDQVSVLVQPSMVAAAVQRRLTMLPTEDPQTAMLLRTLLEVRWYQVQGLISAEVAEGVYRKILGEKRAASLATGLANDRKAAIDDWLSQRR